MKYLFLPIVILFLSCAHHTKNNINIELKMEIGNSYKYDILKELYVIYYINKPPTEIKFKLSDMEKKSINKKYYELNLDKLPEKLTIENNCNIMPKVFNVLNIKRDQLMQQIRIDRSCNDYSLFKKGKAKRINDFIDFIKNILNSKPEIKNAPKSNIHYL